MGSGTRGPSQRQLRVSEVIRQRLAEVLARDDLEAKILKKTSITVTEVRITPDLRHASIYVMPLGGVNLVNALWIQPPKWCVRHRLTHASNRLYAIQLTVTVTCLCMLWPVLMDMRVMQMILV